jgi:hypothetical protein
VPLPDPHGIEDEMTIKSRGLLRLLFMCLLITSAGTAGFLWAQHSETAYLAAGFATLVAMLASLAVENIAANAETQLQVVVSLLKTANADDVVADEKARRLDLIVAMLEEQNEKFRMNLLTNKVHEMDSLRRSELEKASAPRHNQIS